MQHKNATYSNQKLKAKKKQKKNKTKQIKHMYNTKINCTTKMS